MPTCPGCQAFFGSERVLTKHKRKCPAVLYQARAGHDAQQQFEARAKRRRLDNDGLSQGQVHFTSLMLFYKAV